MFEELKTLAKESDEIQARMRKAAEDQVAPALKKAFTELTEKAPEILAIRWHQYTDYFNDGEPCSFYVRELQFSIASEDVDDGDADEDEDDEEYEGDFIDSYRLDKHLSGESLKLAQDFDGEFDSIKDEIMEMAFGDHAQVTLTAKGIKVEEYDHD